MHRIYCIEYTPLYLLRLNWFVILCASLRIQRQFLQSVARSLGNDPKFLHLLRLLEDPDADNDEREKAEEDVKAAVLVYGEWVGHGDLLTVKMIQEARMLMAGSATAFGRQEYLGPFRL